MTSRSSSQARSLSRGDSSSDSDAVKVSEKTARGGARRRTATVYDAVAGRILTTQPLTPGTNINTKESRGRRRGRTASPERSQPGSGAEEVAYGLANPTLAPDEALYRGRAAPKRNVEFNDYPAHTALPDGGAHVLPDSDLLKAVHAHTARFYEAMGARKKKGGGRAECFVGSRLVDERSMDETALLAFGILLEEAGREMVGGRGDLVFTEGLAESDGTEEGDGSAGEKWDRDEEEGGEEEEDEEVERGEKGGEHKGGEEEETLSGGRETYIGLEDGDYFWRRRQPKRRKLRQLVAEPPDGSGLVQTGEAAVDALTIV